ncbi:MAG: hypothetical protein IJ455_00030 [Agathobacter sp.]|nr:hypothetical protein [Agathobacter sp.]
MRYFILLFLIVLLCGCGGKEQDKTDILKDAASENSESQHENSLDEAVKKEDPEFKIILPAKAHIGEKESYTGEWKILVDGYEALEYYPYGKESDNRISAGWIEVTEVNYLRDANRNPYIPWNHSEFSNYEIIGDGFTYICEVEFETYLSDVCQQYGVTRNDGLSHFWCLILIDPTVEEGTTSDWIFLNQRCFTNEEALEIAKTYQPSWR